MSFQEKIQENVSLAPFTTLKIGGPARFFATIHSEPELLEAVTFASSKSLPLFILGGGSNLVVADAGFRGLVLHLILGGSIVTHDQALVSADAGVNWDRFTRLVCEQGICGIECLAGIPGLVGGSPIQNIGAYGQEVASTIRSVRALDRETLQFVDILHKECGFAYRMSIFNSSMRNRYIITRVDFAFARHVGPNLTYADLAPLRNRRTPATPLDVYQAVREIRDRKGMLLHPEAAVADPDTRSAGSFFKNPIVSTDALADIAETLAMAAESVPQWPAGNGRLKVPAAWLIEQAGFSKGYAPSPDSSVAISSRHTLALTNHSGTASCGELLNLKNHISNRVREMFHVSLEQEPVFLS